MGAAHTAGAGYLCTNVHGRAAGDWWRDPTATHPQSHKRRRRRMPARRQGHSRQHKNRWKRFHAQLSAPLHLSPLPRQNSGAPGKGRSITGQAANRRRPPQTVHGIPAGANRSTARAAGPRLPICYPHDDGNHLTPVMSVPWQNQPHLLSTGRWSEGRTGWRAIAMRLWGADGNEEYWIPLPLTAIDLPSDSFPCHAPASHLHEHPTGILSLLI